MNGLSRAREKWLRGLARRRSRAREGFFLAEGVRVVEELLRSGIVPRLAVVSSSLEDTGRGRSLHRRLLAVTEVHEVGDGALQSLADTSATQGVLVAAPIPEGAPPEPRGRSVALVLDGVQDPGNLGTLARTAAAFGCDGLACLPGTVDPWNPKAVRGSAGALFRMPVWQPTPASLVEWLDGAGYLLVGADAEGEPVSGRATGDRVALVVGNEGAGLSEWSRERCERLLSVPMRGGLESLNVAVAGGILLYELTRE